MKLLLESEVEELIEKSLEGPNTNFLKASHNLWKRFKNYSKSLPMGLERSGDIVSIIFATFNRNRYTNLYDIVTMQGEEGQGYARLLWSEYIQYAIYPREMNRLKISCTPSSIGWHLENGLVFWGVDPTGSLKSDQPLYPSVDSQRTARELFVKDPRLAMPEPKVAAELKLCKLERYSFSDSKKKKIQEAIRKTGKFWLGAKIGR